MATTIADNVQPRAQAALSNSPFYELRELQVEQQDGTLLISGSVSSFYQKQLAQEVVRSVCAGIEVVNSIRVELEDDAK
jgi:osmotically-inducible protein OsmY